MTSPLWFPGMRRVMIALSVAAIAWIVVAISDSHYAYAQQDGFSVLVRQIRDEQVRDGAKIDNLQYRLALIESLDLQRRLVRLETVSETNRNLLLAVATAVAVQLLLTISPTMAAVMRNRTKGGSP